MSITKSNRIPRILKSTAVAAAMIAATSVGFTGALTAQAQAAPTCNGAICMYKDALFSPNSPLTVPRNQCGYFTNLKNQGFNDVISSINNNSGFGQRFYQHENRGGYEFKMTAWEQIADLRSRAMTISFVFTVISWDNQISSVLWVG